MARRQRLSDDQTARLFDPPVDRYAPWFAIIRCRAMILLPSIVAVAITTNWASP